MNIKYIKLIPYIQCYVHLYYYVKTKMNVILMLVNYNYILPFNIKY